MDLSLVLYLHQNNLTLSHIEFLRYYEKEMEYFLPKHKYGRDLEKLGYVYESKITKKGIDLLEEIDGWEGVYEPKTKVKKKEIVYSEEFLEFWNSFPKSDNFEGLHGTRDLHKNKPGCFLEWEKLILEYTPEQIINALKVEIGIRLNISKNKAENSFTYMNNTYFYLKGRKFEKYLNQKEIETKKVTLTKDIF